MESTAAGQGRVMTDVVLSDIENSLFNDRYLYMPAGYEPFRSDILYEPKRRSYSEILSLSVKIKQPVLSRYRSNHGRE